MKITEKTKLEKILEMEGGRKVLEKHNLPCLSCPFSKMEMDDLEIGKVSRVYGLDLEKMIKELNELEN